MEKEEFLKLYSSDYEELVYFYNTLNPYLEILDCMPTYYENLADIIETELTHKVLKNMLNVWFTVDPSDLEEISDAISEDESSSFCAITKSGVCVALDQCKDYIKSVANDMDIKIHEVSDHTDADFLALLNRNYTYKFYA